VRRLPIRRRRHDASPFRLAFETTFGASVICVVSGLTTLQAPTLCVPALALWTELKLEQAVLRHGIELGLDLVAIGADATLVFRLAQLVQRSPIVIGQDLEQLFPQVAYDAVVRVAAEAGLLIEEQAPGVADREVAVAILEKCNLA